MSAIKLKTNSYKEAINNKQLVEIIDNIISTYPLTFVSLERLRKEIDKLDELFWIKDEEGKYLLVNNKFSSSLHFATSQIEGKPVDKFIPGYLLNFSEALDEYIKESRSVFIIEGFPLSGVYSTEDYQTIEIPVTDSESKVVGIIGVTQKTVLKSGLKETENIPTMLNLVQSLNKDFALINNDGIISAVNDGFSNLFSLILSEVKGSSYSKVLPAVLRTLIDNFVESDNASQDVEINDRSVAENEIIFHFAKVDNYGIIIIPDAKKSSEDSKLMDATKAYDFLVENNPEPVFIYDKADLRFLQVNNPALKLYGYSRDEFLQLDLTDLYAPDDIQTLLEKNNEGQVESLKPFRQKRKDGNTVFVQLSRINIKYKSKEALFNTVENVTDKLKLQKESQLYTALYENTSNLFFITDRDGFIKSVNSKVAEILGYSTKSLEETSFASLVVDEDRGKINSSVFKSASKEKLALKTSLKKAGNEFLEVQLISNPVLDFNGEIDSYCITCIVEEKEMKEAVKEIVKEVPVEFNIAEEDFSKVAPEVTFLSGIFHDLLTPINVIIGFVQELIEDTEYATPEQKESVEIINQNRANLLNLMNSIIELTQIGRNQIEMKYDIIKVSEIIEKLKKEAKENGTLENIDLAYGKISSSLEVKTDLNKFKKLLALVLTIIVKISHKKKIYLSSSTFSEEHFVIYIRDEYSSLSEDFADRLNSVFVNDRKFSGRELGISLVTLSLCKSLLRLLGGEFKVFGESDAGFIFPFDLTKKVELPKEETENEEKVIEEEEEVEEQLKVEVREEKVQVTKFEEVTFLKERDDNELQQQSIDISGLSCLYLEDQPDSQMLFSAEMKDLKEINFAAGFDEALPLLKSKRFDFIVADINLQGDYNGLDVLRIIRTMPDYEDVPVIAITAYLLPGDKEKFLQAGFSDFISKPISRGKLLNSLGKMVVSQS
jgi:PAS domain S-box-containing protein